jgi:integrase
MKTAPIPVAAASATLQDVVDRLASDPSLAANRNRDLRSAVVTIGKLVGQPLRQIPLDLAEIRRVLDGTVPAQVKVSAKRWANLRSDLAAAIAASGLHPILTTGKLKLDRPWSSLFGPISDLRIRNGLCRFARWASLRRITPAEVDAAIVERFIAELKASTLVRNLADRKGGVIRSWNVLAKLQASAGPQISPIKISRPAPIRMRWESLPPPFQQDVASYLTWASVPDPLDEHARARALSPGTLRLRRDQIHSAAAAAIAAGTEMSDLASLASLVEPETFKKILRQCWERDGRKLSAYTHGVAGTLIAIAREWVRVPAEILAKLKALRAKLGSLLAGMTEKNRATLRKFDDPRLLTALIEVPDKLWRRARRDLATSRRPFIDLQSALAIDLLLHAPVRMENLSSLRFGEHIHWPQGRGKPALMRFGLDETKNEVQLEFEISAELGERLWTYREEIAPKVTGSRPDAVFVTWAGKPKTQAALSIAIERTVLRNIGIKITPHQFRHICAKIILDANPGAHELVRQLLGHLNLKTTTNYYAGQDTRRAGRAHADLIMKLRDQPGPDGIRRIRKPRKG